MSDWIGFYSTTQVARLAQIPLGTLRDWRRRGIIEPSVTMEADGQVIEEGYSYADLTIIRLLRALRKDQIDLTSAGIALRHLFDRLGPPSAGWADAHVYFVGRRIFAERGDAWGTTAATQFGQLVEERLFGDLFGELRAMEEGASILVPREHQKWVTIDPNVMGGEPVVRGTRIPTAALYRMRRAGRTLSDIANTYPRLARAAIRSALSFETALERAHA